MSGRVFSPQFGTLALTPANGVTVSAIRAFPRQKATFAPPQAGDHSLLVRHQLDGARIELAGVVAGNTHDEAQTRLDNLMYALHQGPSVLQVHKHSPTTDSRWIDCYLERFDHDFIDNGLMNAGQWRANFRSLSPYWYRADETTDTFSIVTSKTDLVLSTNNGSAPAEPTITVTNNTSVAVTGRKLILTNISADQTLVVQGLNMEVGQILVFDMMRGRTGDGTVAPGRYSSIEGEWWALAPGAASSLQVVTDVSVASGSGLGLSVNWNDQYYTF